MTSRLWMPALAGLCLLSACSHGGPPPPPMTAFVPGACAPALTLQGAAVTPVVMEKEAKVSFGVTTSCMVLGDGAPTLYSVFSLPVQADTYLITVRSLPIGEGMIIPRLLLMDDNNVVLRTVDGESFTFHGASMMTKLRSHPGETHLVVAVDTRYVGQEVAQVAESFRASSTTTVVNRAVFSTFSTTGASNMLNYVFSFNGDIVVSAEPMPKA